MVVDEAAFTRRRRSEDDGIDPPKSGWSFKVLAAGPYERTVQCSGSS